MSKTSKLNACCSKALTIYAKGEHAKEQVLLNALEERAARIAVLEKEITEARKDSERWAARLDFLLSLEDGFQTYREGDDFCIVVNVDPDLDDKHFCAASWSDEIDLAEAAIQAHKEAK